MLDFSVPICAAGGLCVVVVHFHGEKETCFDLTTLLRNHFSPKNPVIAEPCKFNCNLARKDAPTAGCSYDMKQTFVCFRIHFIKQNTFACF